MERTLTGPQLGDMVITAEGYEMLGTPEDVALFANDARRLKELDCLGEHL